MTYVRRAIETDLPEILPMARRFHAESPVHSRLSFNQAKVENLIRVAFVDPAWLAAVAVNDAGITGMGLFFCLPEFYSDDKVAGDFAFFVDRHRRGSRAAMALVDYAVAWAHEQGARAFNLGIHTGINHKQAVEFFSRCNFEQSGVLMSRTFG